VTQARNAESDGQAFISAQTLVMRLSSVAEALEMFAWSFRHAQSLGSHSKKSDVDVFRISADLAAEQAAGEDKFSMSIVLRRYDAAHDAADAT
jgi:hypothetical protein